jgi:hypothetical protein
VIDLDPCRPSGIPSTDVELASAIERRTAVATFLGEMGFPEPVVAMSGNGGHLLYAVDLPNDETVRDLYIACLAALAARFSGFVLRRRAHPPGP